MVWMANSVSTRVHSSECTLSGPCMRAQTRALHSSPNISIALKSRPDLYGILLSKLVPTLTAMALRSSDDTAAGEGQGVKIS